MVVFLPAEGRARFPFFKKKIENPRLASILFEYGDGDVKKSNEKTMMHKKIDNLDNFNGIVVIKDMLNINMNKLN